MPTRKSMAVRVYLQSAAKRAKTTALVDSGAMENFMNLKYAKWLRLPIETMEQPRNLFNVDGTENTSGKLHYYTDLLVKTGNKSLRLRFFLSNFGTNNVILGYPWFAANQPNINWKTGWIDYEQLPIVLKADNANKARILPWTKRKQHKRTTNPSQDRLFIGKVTFNHPKDVIGPTIEGVPLEYQCHNKVFSKQESQRLLEHTICDHAIELVPDVTNLFVTGACDRENARDHENTCDQVAPTSHMTVGTHVTSGPLRYHVTYHVTHHVIQLA